MGRGWNSKEGGEKKKKRKKEKVESQLSLGVYLADLMTTFGTIIQVSYQAGAQSVLQHWHPDR
jgi:hypothetical protein